MTFTYILRGQNNYYYCGITNHIAQRIIQHNKGASKSTRKNKPYTIIHTEIFTDRKAARVREKQIKNFGVRRWYEKNIKFSQHNTKHTTILHSKINEITTQDSHRNN